MGASATRIISKHLVPNILSIVVVNLTLSIPSAIFNEAFLSFIGLGVPIPLASWGTLANEGVVVFQTQPIQLIIPAFFISITMLSFNLLGDKLRDAFDPKSVSYTHLKRIAYHFVIWKCFLDLFF